VAILELKIAWIVHDEALVRQINLLVRFTRAACQERGVFYLFVGILDKNKFFRVASVLIVWMKLFA